MLTSFQQGKLRDDFNVVWSTECEHEAEYITTVKGPDLTSNTKVMNKNDQTQVLSIYFSLFILILIVLSQQENACSLSPDLSFALGPGRLCSAPEIH